MTHKRAIKLAIQALGRWVRDLSVDANLYEVYGMNTPVGVSASEKRERLEEAIRQLREESGG